MKARDAQQLLESPILNEAFDSVKDELVKGLEDGYHTQEAQDMAVITMQLLVKLRQRIQGIADEEKKNAFIEERRKLMRGHEVIIN